MSVETQGLPSEADFGSQMAQAQRALRANAEMVTFLLPDFDQVSITVVDSEGSAFSCAQAGGLVGELDRLQYGLGEGPCIESLRGVVPVVVSHIEQDERWRDYVRAAAELGLRSQVATPLRWGEGQLMGVLNLYSTTRGEIAPSAPRVAEAIAAQIAGSLAGFREIENLQRALATRRTVGAAIGMLMAQYKLTETAAFAVLERRATFASVNVGDIAAQMVAEGNVAGLELPPAATC